MGNLRGNIPWPACHYEERVLFPRRGNLLIRGSWTSLFFGACFRKIAALRFTPLAMTGVVDTSMAVITRSPVGSGRRGNLLIKGWEGNSYFIRRPFPGDCRDPVRFAHTGSRNDRALGQMGNLRATPSGLLVITRSEERVLFPRRGNLPIRGSRTSFFFDACF
ncbi:MAG: hypothetical protein U5K69_07765 [Balneolaceae bacterium]|nr:hypothetical protein [Balneolaceae bacterium]